MGREWGTQGEHPWEYIPVEYNPVERISGEHNPGEHISGKRSHVYGREAESERI